MRKVLVIGSPGSGKSVFSRTLGKLTGLPVIHLDQHYWRAGWVEPSKDEWDKQLDELLRRDSWIIDGNYSRTMDRRLEYCDTVIFIDFPKHLCTWRVLKRALRFSDRPDLAAGCDERFDLRFLRWTWNFPKRSRARVVERLERVGEKMSVVRLTTTREVEDLFSALASRFNNENGN